jgi:hexosaminidase
MTTLSTIIIKTPEGQLVTPQVKPTNSIPLTMDMDIQVAESGELVVNLFIHNRLGRDIYDWTLHFDLPKTIASGLDSCLLSQVGSHMRMTRTDAAPLRDGETATLQFTGLRAIIQRLTDLPDGAYLDSEGITLPLEIGSNNLAQLDGINAVTDHPATPGSSTGEGAAGSDDCNPVSTKPDIQKFNLLPQAVAVHPRTGRCSGSTLGVAKSPAEAGDAINWLQAIFPPDTIVNSIVDTQPELAFSVDKSLGLEEYRLTVHPTDIVATASSSAGFFYAMVTLGQLWELETDNIFSIPCVEISDQPRFEYRGLMLDCARQFHTKETILKLLDLMARYKYNRFHWHLTDDEGWRIEIKAYPELTAIGAWRGANEVLEPQFGSGANRYGGFYTHSDIQEVIEYARQCQIMVIPEVDIPGHSRAAIKSLPALLVEPQDDSQYCSEQMYNDNVLNPALPGTYEFLHRVLDEVCELFPGPYVHIGADEVPVGVWVNSPACQTMMQEHDYQEALDLQTHLLRDLQGHLAKRGKELMGWEEASHGGKLDHAAIIFAWSAVHIPPAIANQGYRVVACPAPFAYLDMAWNYNINEPGFHWAGTADLASSYAYDPCLAEYGEQANSQIMGVQALLWSELLASPERLEYMMFPRALALAETAWSNPGRKDWTEFQRRVKYQLTQLQQIGVRHRAWEEE